MSPRDATTGKVAGAGCGGYAFLDADGPKIGTSVRKFGRAGRSLCDRQKRVKMDWPSEQLV